MRRNLWQCHQRVAAAHGLWRKRTDGDVADTPGTHPRHSKNDVLFTVVLICIGVNRPSASWPSQCGRVSILGCKLGWLFLVDNMFFPGNYNSHSISNRQVPSPRDLVGLHVLHEGFRHLLEHGPGWKWGFNQPTQHFFQGIWMAEKNTQISMGLGKIHRNHGFSHEMWEFLGFFLKPIHW